VTFEDRFVRVLGDGLGDTGSACDCSGEAEVAARLSRSSKRRFSFLPVGLRRVRNVALGWDLSFFFFPYDSCAGRYGFGCADALRGQRSWSSPRLGWRLG
jgi:hypothetical protein